MLKRFLTVLGIVFTVLALAPAARAGSAVEWSQIRNHTNRPWNLRIDDLVFAPGIVSLKDPDSAAAIRIYDAQGNLRNRNDQDVVKLATRGDWAVLPPGRTCLFRIDPHAKTGIIALTLKLFADIGPERTPVECTLNFNNTRSKVLDVRDFTTRSKRTIKLLEENLGHPDKVFIELGQERP